MDNDEERFAETLTVAGEATAPVRCAYVDARREQGPAMLLLDRSIARHRLVLWVARLLGVSRAPKGYSYADKLDYVLAEVRAMRREGRRARSVAAKS